MAHLVLRDDSDPDDIVEAIDLLASDQRYEFELRFAQLLDHEDLGVRSQALCSLIVQWKKEEYLATAYEWTRQGGANARWAADAREMFLVYTGRHREPILRAMARVVDEAHEDDLAAVYRFFSTALGRNDLIERVPPICDREGDIDWDLLRPYLAS